MVSLVMYIISFVLIVAIVATVTTFYNNNIRDLNDSESVSAEYSKFNAYMLNYTKSGYEISQISDDYVTFLKDSDYATFVKQDDILYFNQIKLCDNVKDFSVKTAVAENGKDVLKTYININGTVYTTDYVIE